MWGKVFWRRRRSSLLAWMVAGLFGLVVVPCAEAAPAPEGESVAHRLWDKLLTHCGSSYFYSGSVFDGSGMLSDVQIGHQAVIEYQGVRFRTVPIRVTDAERANGLTYRARISMIAHLYREGGKPWRDGPDMRPRNTDDIIAQAIGQANSDMFDMGGSGAMALELVKFKGIWAVTRSSTTSSSALGFGSKFFDVEKVIAARVARYSCEKGAVLPPPPTAAELAAQKEAERQRAEAARKAAEQAAEAERARVAAAAEQEQKVAKLKSELEVKLAPWRFEGTPDQFMAALRENLAKRGAEYGFDPTAYESELRQIQAMVQVCMAVTPDDWRRAEAAFPSDKKPPPNFSGPNPTTPRMRRLQGCDGGAETAVYGERISPAGKPYALGVTRSMSNADGPTPYFAITVALFLNHSDLAKAEYKYFEFIPAYSYVIDAKIPRPASAS